MRSSLQSSFIGVLTDPKVTSVLLTGCGGGFDFVHSMLLINDLKAAGKRIVICSYSFGHPLNIRGGVLYHRPATGLGETRSECYTVNGECIPDRNYGPEVGMCQFLDSVYPADAPHSIYACYARDFTVPLLSELYEKIIAEHKVDCLIAVDGGSDSLMAGDESGLGDPVEDAVSVATMTLLSRKLGPEVIYYALLVCIGVGCDRFNGVSDAATLRAVSEIAGKGGFLGVAALEKDGVPITLYDRLIEYLQGKAFFRSVIANSIVESAKGAFGSDVVPRSLARRVSPGELFFWPLMCMLFAFRIDVVFDRSLLAPRIVDAATIPECYERLSSLRKEVTIRRPEVLPMPE